MKRKGLFLGSLSIVAIAMICFFTAACESEQVNSGDDSLVVEKGFIEGTWKCAEEYADYTLGFKKDGTGTYVCHSHGSGNQTFTGTLTYYMSSDNSGFMIVKYRSEDYDPGEYATEMYYFVIVDDKMHLLEGDDGLILSNANSLSFTGRTFEGSLTSAEEYADYTFGFKKDGTGTYVCNSHGSGNQTFTGTLTYYMSSDNSGFMIVKYRSDYYDPGEYNTEMYFFVIADDKMYMLEGDDGLIFSNVSSLSLTGRTFEGSLTSAEEYADYTFGFKKDGTGTYVCHSHSSGNQTFVGTLTYYMTSDNSGFMIVKYRSEDYDPGEYATEPYLFVITDDKMYLLEGYGGFVLSKQ